MLLPVPLLLVLCLGLAVGAAIFRYRLWDIDLIINRTLVYGLLSACVISLYVLIVGYFGTTLKLPYVAVALIQSDVPTLSEERLVAICDQPPPHALVERLPLVYQGEAVGHLVLVPGSGEAHLTRTDRRLLEDLARHAGVIAHAVRLTTDLRRSRERLVVTREEERRRLRRDLHDGLGPTLASLTLTLAAAREYLPRDPTATDTLLQELATQVQGSGEKLLLPGVAGRMGISFSVSADRCPNAAFVRLLPSLVRQRGSLPLLARTICVIPLPKHSLILLPTDWTALPCLFRPFSNCLAMPTLLPPPSH